MSGYREHPLDKPLEAMVKALEDADAELGHMTANIRDFDSKELTPQEDELVFHNPSLRYLGQVEPVTGLPYTNAQAAQRLLQDVGPEQYVRYVEDVVQRMDRRAASGKEGSDATTTTGMAVGQGPDTAADVSSSDSATAGSNA